jgi:RNA polymerase sigma factor (sigma-70 family)
MAYSAEIALPAGSCRDDEAALVARALAGDDDAFARLVRPHERAAYRVAAALAGSADDAQEAVQNAYVKAHRSLPSFRAGAAFKPWLLQIVVNEAHNVRRSEQRHERLGVRAAERLEPPSTDADECVVAREEVACVLQALARLSEADRIAVAMRYFAELPDRDAAALAGVSTGAYRVRVLRALRRLRVILEEHDD